MYVHFSGKDASAVPRGPQRYGRYPGRSAAKSEDLLSRHGMRRQHDEPMARVRSSLRTETAPLPIPERGETKGDGAENAAGGAAAIRGASGERTVDDRRRGRGVLR